MATMEVRQNTGEQGDSQRVETDASTEYDRDTTRKVIKLGSGAIVEIMQPEEVDPFVYWQ